MSRVRFAGNYLQLLRELMLKVLLMKRRGSSLIETTGRFLGQGSKDR